jgi:hypothetical protein
MASLTTSNGNYYEFSFEQQSDGSIRIYIDYQPSYGYRSSDSHITHRNKDGNRYYICVLDQPRTVSEAKVIAEEWAKRTDRYIRSGVPLDAQGSTPAWMMAV